MPQSDLPAPLRVFRHAGKNLSVILYGSMQIKRHVLQQEEQMNTPESNTATQDEILHSGPGSKLSAEEIAKAVAHHNRHHGGDQPQEAPQQGAPAKKKK